MVDVTTQLLTSTQRTSAKHQRTSLSHLMTMWSKKTYALDFVIGYEDVQVDAWLYSDHQRYFFFQQISTVGALLQLVVHGPGRYSLDEQDGPVQVVTLTSKGMD